MVLFRKGTQCGKQGLGDPVGSEQVDLDNLTRGPRLNVPKASRWKYQRCSPVRGEHLDGS